MEIAVRGRRSIGFVFRFVCRGAEACSWLLGMMLGLTFIAMAKGFGFLVLIYGMPPMMGAFTPLIMFMIIAVVMLRKVA